MLGAKSIPPQIPRPSSCPVARCKRARLQQVHIYIYIYLLPQKLLSLIDFQENDRFAFLVLKFQHWCYKNRSGLRSRPNLMLLMSLAGNPSIALFLHNPLHVYVIFAS